MATGNKPLEKVERIGDLELMRCMCCNNEMMAKEFYESDSELYGSIGRLPYCKECIGNLYKKYYEKYKELGYGSPDKKAVERICMAFDLYYSDKVFDSAYDKYMESESGSSVMTLYMKHIKMYQYRTKDYNTTIHDRYLDEKRKGNVEVFSPNEARPKNERIALAKDLFGEGFEDSDYTYLYKQYTDWTARHECNTKAQEEVFKNICLTQLQLLKATRAGDNTKDISMQLKNWLDAGKLQPKQNSGESVSDAQTFGTLIDKWENTRPIPEVDEELKDVDRIGQYIDVFFRGHLAKMMGIKNSLSALYDRVMKKYTVEKPDYDVEEEDDAMFEAIFGRNLEDEEMPDGRQD